MAATPEALVKKQIRKILDAEGVYYAMPMGTGYGNSGVPDFLCCVAGKFLAIEAKAGRGTTTALQDAHIEKIGSAGGVAMVINEKNLDSLMPLIRYMQGKP
jgi:pantoate kinase